MATPAAPRRALLRPARQRRCRERTAAVVGRKGHKNLCRRHLATRRAPRAFPARIRCCTKAGALCGCCASAVLRASLTPGPHRGLPPVAAAYAARAARAARPHARERGGRHAGPLARLVDAPRSGAGCSAGASCLPAPGATLTRPAQGARLAHTRFAAVYCSDLGRCVETLQIASSKRTGVPQPAPQFLPLLRERGAGVFEGTPLGTVDAAAAAAGTSARAFRPPGGESWADVRARAATFLQQCVRPAAASG